jgi:hypothetical protein
MKKFLSEYPELVSEWHPTKNRELKPEEVTHGSDRSVWWLCPKGHSYDSVISNRTSKNKTGCPFCSGNKPSEDNNLKFLFPEISKEWHPKKNGDSRPEEFASRSHKIVWWLCPKGHSYESLISYRTRKNNTGCQKCKSLDFLFPEISKEWHPKKNGDSRPEEFASRSHKIVWWLCPNGHSYESSIKNKTTKKTTGCQKCKSLDFLFPEISKEWHPKKNGELKPEGFTHGSSTIVWWLCPKGHSYDSSISSRTSKNKTGCPFCSGNKASEDNNLKFLFPEISKEWHPTKNRELKPEEVTYGSGKIVWWLCPKGHSYSAQILSRTYIKHTGCPFCSNQSSSPELRILSEFRFIFDDVKNRHKIEGVEMDVYVPKLNLSIEYDGSYFHQGKEKKDLEKNEFLQLRNIEVFRVRCSPLTKITENDLIIENDDLSKSDLNRIFKKIYSFGDNEIKEKIDEYFDSDIFLNENLFREYISYLPSPLPENSLTTNYPDLVNEWDYEKNHPLIPDQFSGGTQKKVWWLCPNGHSYNLKISKRTSKQKQGCQKCKILDFLFPEISKEWHPTKNRELKPDEFSYGSNKKIWWLCPKGHSYDSVIKSRTGKQKTGCPDCYKDGRNSS